MDSNMDSNKNKRKKQVRSQDDKQKRARDAERKRQLKDFNAFLLRARRDSDFWKSPFCANLRAFHAYALSHATQFPMAPGDSPLVESQDPLPSLLMMPELSKNFIKQTTNEFYQISDTTVQPTVRVLNCDIRYEDSGYHTSHPKAKRARLLLWDGSDKVLVGVTVSNLLHAVQHQLTSGQPIIRLKSFNIAKYTDIGTASERLSDAREKPGVVIVQYQFLCRPLTDVDPNQFSQAYFDDDNEELHQAENDESSSSEVSTGENIRALADPSTDFHRQIIAFQQRTDVRRLPDSSIKFCKPMNRLCSRYGQRFPYCLAEKYETRVKSTEFLESISEHIYFVDREVSEMTNTLKRNALYYWFATNLYFVKGAGKRKELPECLLCLIRMTYPNDPNMPYKGFSRYSQLERELDDF